MFGPQIREARMRRNLSQVALARLAGIDRNQLRDLEDDGNVTIASLRKVLAVLPDLTYLMVQPAAPPEMVSADAVRAITRRFRDLSDELLALTGDAPSPERRIGASGLPTDVEAHVRRVERQLAAGTARIEHVFDLDEDEPRQHPPKD